MDLKTKLPRNRSPLFIAGLYVLISTFWIVYSDKIVKVMAHGSPDTLSVLQTFKGGFFVISTGLLLYYLIRSRMKKLMVSETRFKTLAENTPDAIICLDPEGHYIYGNTVFEQLMDVSDEQLFGKNFRNFDLNGELIQKLEEAFDKALASKTSVRVEFQFGGNRWFDTIIAPQLSETGGIISVVASSRDVTEQKKMQEQLQQSQKMQAIGQLAGGIAHDFNNILSVILGYSDMALNNTATDELQKEFLLNIKKGGMRAKDLVQQILSFSRKKPEVCEPIYLKPIVREVIGFLRGTLPSSIKFTCNIQKETEPVMGNSSNIHEILMNLATNAQHAMDEKGHLAVNLYEKVIEKPFSGAIGPVETGHYSIIEVIDDGAGISGDKISLIFDPFYTTKEVGEGTGLGLSVVFGLMQSCQGNIEVISKEGVGTTFKLYFPKTNQKIDEKDQKILAENLKNGSGRILLVDDDETIVKMGNKMLTLLGYEVTAIQDSRQALKLLKNNIDAYDLLISDQTMPGLTGMELAIEVLKENPEFPILLCTGYSSKVDEKKALELGCRGFVHKPLTIDDMSKKIREILREKKFTK